jgi:hypothetical protein
MKVHFGQVYIRAGVRFPFTHHFQARLSKEISELVTPSAQFVKRFGQESDLTIDISAKKDISECEIRGPGLFKDSKKVHYSVFLPFDVIMRDSNTCCSALTFLLNGVTLVLRSFAIDTAGIECNTGRIVDEICSDETMFG